LCSRSGTAKFSIGNEDSRKEKPSWSYVIAIHLFGGSRHEHIAEHWWLDPGDAKTGQTGTAGMVEYIEKRNGSAKVGSSQGPVEVRVVHPQQGAPYLRTVANKTWTDNLLSLPKILEATADRRCCPRAPSHWTQNK
jgi:hypothetical protein